MKIQCDLCKGTLEMEAGGKRAKCVNCGMSYSWERIQEMLAESQQAETEQTESEQEDNQAEEIVDEPVIYDAKWEEASTDDDETILRYIPLEVELHAPSNVSFWEKIGWDLYNTGNCEFSVDFSDDTLSKLFPEEYALYKQKYDAATKPSEQIEAIGILSAKTAFEVQLTEEQMAVLKLLMDALVHCEAVEPEQLSPTWEIRLNYPNHDVKHEIRGRIDESSAELVQLKEFFLDLFREHIGKRYPWIFYLNMGQ